MSRLESSIKNMLRRDLGHDCIARQKMATMVSGDDLLFLMSAASLLGMSRGCVFAAVCLYFLVSVLPVHATVGCSCSDFSPNECRSPADRPSGCANVCGFAPCNCAVCSTWTAGGNGSTAPLVTCVAWDACAGQVADGNICNTAALNTTLSLIDDISCNTMETWRRGIPGFFLALCGVFLFYTMCIVSVILFKASSPSDEAMERISGRLVFCVMVASCIYVVIIIVVGCVGSAATWDRMSSVLWWIVGLSFGVIICGLLMGLAGLGIYALLTDVQHWKKGVGVCLTVRCLSLWFAS